MHMYVAFEVLSEQVIRFTFKLLYLIMKKIVAIERNHVGTPRSSKEV